MVWLQEAAATDTDWVSVLTWTDQISLLTVFFYAPKKSVVSAMQVFVLTFTHKLQQWNCMGWKKWPLVTKQVSVDCLGPRVLDRGLGAGGSSTGNANAAWAQLQVNNRESLANWGSLGLGVGEEGRKSFKNFSESWEIPLKIISWVLIQLICLGSTTLRITCSFRPLSFLTSYWEVVRENECYTFEILIS